MKLASGMTPFIHGPPLLHSMDTVDPIEASKSSMSKSHYLHCKSLHSLPRFASRTQRILVGNGQVVSVLFIILIIVDIHRHRFQIYTLVSEIHESTDLVLGIINIFKLEGVINS